MRTVFFGTPPLAVASLKALTHTSDVVGVVCQPDRRAGRGMKLRACPVKEAALELGLPVHQPVKVRTGTLHEWLKEREVDAAVVLAYGRILPPLTLAAPKLGCINLHASLLPGLRGAAPINWAIARGESVTGVTLMQMSEGLDCGPTFCRRETELERGLDAGTLAHRISDLCAQMIREDLPRVLNGELVAVAQDESLATLAPPITAEHLIMDWSRPALELERQVLGFSPRPGAYTQRSGRRFKLLDARATEYETSREPPGTVLKADGKVILVQAGDAPLQVLRAQAEGKKVMTAQDLINGRQLQRGECLGE